MLTGKVLQLLIKPQKHQKLFTTDKKQYTVWMHACMHTYYILQHIETYVHTNNLL